MLGVLLLHKNTSSLRSRSAVGRGRKDDWQEVGPAGGRWTQETSLFNTDVKKEGCELGKESRPSLNHILE